MADERIGVTPDLLQEKAKWKDRSDEELMLRVQEGEKAFGKYDRGHVEEAKTVASEWFPV